MQPGRRRFIERGGGWVIGQAVLMVAVVAAGPGLAGRPWPAAARAAGALGLLAGALVGLAGVASLGRYRTIFPRPVAGSRLIQGGVYGVVRHPLYSSVVLVSLGWTLLWSSGVGVLLAAVLGVFLEAKARREERWLRERFPEYEAYARRVKRLIPWLY